MKSPAMICVKALLLLLAFNTHAEPDTALKPGQYIREGDSGVLSIERKSDGQLHFLINTVGANCHLCEVSGTIRGGQASAGDNKACRISFEKHEAALEVAALTGDCRDFCGARAYFDGRYQIPPPNCTEKARKAARNRFLAQYKARKYGPAQKNLEDLLTQCPAFMDFIEQDKMRSDLALAQLHDGHPEACLKTLAKTVAGESQEGELPLPPCESDNYADTAKAIWFNQKLCRKPKKGPR